MIRHLFITLALLIALVVPASASTRIYSDVPQIGAGNGTSATLSLPAYKVGQKIYFIVSADAAALSITGPTTPATGWTTEQTEVSGTGMTAVLYSRVATGSEPSSYTASWTGSFYYQSAIVVVENTDGSTPVSDISGKSFTNSASSLLAPQVTPTQNNDFLLYFCTAGWGVNAMPAPAATTFSEAVNFINMGYGFAGQDLTGLSYAQNCSFNNTTSAIAFTVAIKSNTITAPAFIGNGTESYYTSTLAVSPILPVNGSTGDTELVAISELGTSGVAITQSYGASGYDNVIIADSPIVYLPLNGSVTDFSGNNVSISGSNITYTTGYAADGSQSAIFNGTNTNISVTNTTESTPTTIEYVSAPSTTSPIGIIDTGVSSTNTFRNYNTGNLEWWNGNPNVSLALSNTSAHFFDIILDISGGNRRIRYYRDNSLISTTSGTGSTGIAWSNPFNIGSINGGSAGRYTGNLQKFAIYNVALTPTQITNHYTAFTSNTTPAINTYWTKIGASLVEADGTKELDLYWAPYSTLIPISFNFASAIKASGMVFGLNNLDGTTPFDAECALLFGSLDGQMFPSCTPTPNDELLFRITTSGSNFSTPADFIYWGGSSGIAAAIDDLTNAGAILQNYHGSFGGSTGPYVSVTLGMHAATTPTRTTANADINQAALEVFTTTLPSIIVTPSATAEIIS